MKINELGHLWLSDNLKMAKAALANTERSLATMQNKEGNYALQIKILIRAQGAVVNVWQEQLTKLEAGDVGPGSST